MKVKVESCAHSSEWPDAAQGPPIEDHCTTRNTTLNTNYTLQTHYMSQISKLAISVAVCITTGVPHTTSPVLQQPNLLLVDTFVTKARFYHFFLHQTQSKRDGNVREKA